MPQENDEDYFDCYGCGEPYHVDDRYTSDYDGEWRCEGCYGEHLDDRHYEEERNMQDDCGVYDYSYRPDTMYFYSGFHGKNTWAQPNVLGYKFEDNALYVSAKSPTELYIGAELETESCGRMYVEGADHVYNTLTPDQVYLKHDGSLSNGFEIVTMPMTMDWFMNNFDWTAISGLSDLGFKAWNRRSCGLHLHMSRSAFTGPKHLFKFFYLMYKNSPQMIKFAGRESSYASWDIRAFLNRQGWFDESVTVNGNSIMDMAKAKSINDNRYCAINVRNRATIELRFFRPSLRPETVQAAIQMTDAAFRYTAGVSTVDVMKNNALAFDSFKAWVNEGEFKDRYAVLAQRISERVIG